MDSLSQLEERMSKSIEGEESTLTFEEVSFLSLFLPNLF